MKGSKKSRADLVRNLSKMWDTYYSTEKYLKAVGIDKIKGQPLRGIKDARLSVSFPLTVLTGANGSGKTTFLELAVLGFHSDNTITETNSQKGYFDFSYFFGFSEKEKHQPGIKIYWEYSDGEILKITKGDQRWMRYMKNDENPRRPKRGTEFIGLSRISPAFERKGYKKTNFQQAQKQGLNMLSTYMGRIMGRPYNSVEAFSGKNNSGVHSFHNYNKTHSSFNAGAGEECLAYILRVLLTSEVGSVVAIEEIEIGLHPGIMERLVDVMLEIIADRKLQVFITSHSPEFLRNCPIESLVLCEREKEKLVFISQPNVEYAVHSIGGKTDDLLYILCEDNVAKELINMAMDAKQRRYVRVLGYGGKSELVSKALTLKLALKQPVVIVWDGDVTKQDQNKAKSDYVDFALLPGSASPEEAIRESICNGEIDLEITQQFGTSSYELGNLKEQLSVLPNSHDLFFCLSEHLNLKEDDVFREICQAYYRCHKQEFEGIKSLIARYIPQPLTVAA